MFKGTNIKKQLDRLRKKNRQNGDDLVLEARRILKQELFAEEKILENLGQYNQSFGLLNEEDLDKSLVFSTDEIKQICIMYRLKFLDAKVFKPDIPYESVLKVKDLNKRFGKNVEEFKILAPFESFSKKEIAFDAMLFAQTNYDNYYMIHRWGKALPWYRKFRYWPMRHFETLFATVIVITAIIAFSLPIKFITLDPKADYWSGYRAAAFFHLLIFNLGVTAYTTFTFAKNFSSSIWNRERDFD